MQYDFSESFRTIRCNILYSLLGLYLYRATYMFRATFSEHIPHMDILFHTENQIMIRYISYCVVYHRMRYIYALLCEREQMFLIFYILLYCMAYICKTCKRDCTKLWVIVFSTSSTTPYYMDDANCNKFVKIKLFESTYKTDKKHWTEATLMFIVRFSPYNLGNYCKRKRIYILKVEEEEIESSHETNTHTAYIVCRVNNRLLEGICS